MRRKKKKDNLDWLKCPRCGSKQILYQKLTNSYWCRKCGCQFKADFDKRDVRPVIGSNSVVD